MEAVAVLLLALPWLNPFAPAPSPAVVPWLVALAAAAGALLLLSWRRLCAPELVATAWLLAALLSCGIALCQYFGIAHLFWPWMNLPADIYANLRQRNHFASLVNIGLLALLWWAARTKGPWLAGGAAWLLGAGNALSGSRTGLLELALIVLLVGGVWGGWRQATARRVLGLAMLGYAATSVLMVWLVGTDPLRSGIASRFGGDGCGSRLVQWHNVWELIRERPWGGWGWGELDYAHFMHRYDGPRFCDIMGNAHNLPLHLAVELGVPVALLLCAAAMWLVLRGRPWREADPQRRLAWGVLAVIGLHSLLEYPLWYGHFQLAAVLALAMLGPARPPVPAGSPAATASPVQMALAAVLLAGVAYAALEYRRISQIYRPPEQRAAAYRENTLARIGDSWLFRSQVRFATLGLAPLTRANAAEIHALALDLLHYSPEASVVEKVIESAMLLGREAQAAEFAWRYRAAYPQAYARWAGRLRAGP